MKREAATVDVSKLEPVWVAEERAKLAADLQRFIARFPNAAVVGGKLVLKPAAARKP